MATETATIRLARTGMPDVVLTASTDIVPAQAPFNPRTFDWSTVGRPKTTSTKTATINTAGNDKVGVHLTAGDLVVDKPTKLVQDCQIDGGGWLYIWTGSRLDLAEHFAVFGSKGNGVGNVTEIRDFRIEGSWNDGLTMSLGAPPNPPATWKPFPYRMQYAKRGVIFNRGYLPAGATEHCDNIQLWSGKHYSYQEMLLGALPGPYPQGSTRVNSLIIVKSDIIPWDGSGDPITDALFEDMLLDLTLGNGYNNVIYVREGGSPAKDASGNYVDAGATYKRRPKDVTFRRIVVSNLASGAKPDPKWLISTSYQFDYAVFVRTEAERQQGIANQIADPTVIQRRLAALKPSRSGMIWPDMVDAHSWIVWDDVQYQDGTQITPPGGFYNLSAG